MTRAAPPTGIELEFDTFGDPRDPALWLVMGFTAQMTAWQEGFCHQLADMGHDMPEPLWPMLVAAIDGHGDAAVATAQHAMAEVAA